MKANRLPFTAINVASLGHYFTLSPLGNLLHPVRMDLKITTKKEKKTERLVFLVPASLKERLTRIEREREMDVPEFFRNLLDSALSELENTPKSA